MSEINNREQYIGAIEAILFSLGNPVESEKIAEILDLPVEDVHEILESMLREYEGKNRGITLTKIDHAYQICTKKEYYFYIQKATEKMVKFELSDVQLETLSIIAYKQPVTKLHIEKIRGVKSDHAVNRLIEYGLIEEKGRLDTPGRPILFGTSKEFLRTFGLSSTNELPTMEEQEFNKLKGEVEAEWNITFEELDKE